MMDKINSGLCIFLIVLTQISIWVPMGLTLTALNPTASVLKSFVNESFWVRYHASATEESMSLVITLGQAVLIAGSAIGALSVRFWLNLFSRRTVMIIVHSTSLLSAVLMSAVAFLFHSYEALILGRFIGGLARGLGFNVGPLFVAEICNRKTLALYQSMPGWILLFSGALGNALGHPSVLGGPSTWPVVLGLPGVVSVVYLLSLPWIPNTLTCLMQPEGCDSNANKTAQVSSINLLRKLRCGTEQEVSEEHEILKAEVDADLHVEKASVKQIVSIGKYRRQLIAAVFLQFSFQACGEQVVLQYTNVLFEETGANPEHSTFFTIGNFGLMAVATMLGTPLLSKFGGRKMLIAGLSVCSVGIILLIVSSVTSKHIPNMTYVGIAAMAILIIGIAVGPLLTIASLPSEITSQIIRPNAMWLSGAVFWISGAGIAFIFPYSIEAWGGYAYAPFLFLVIFEIVFVFFFIPETSNKSALAVQNYFEKGKTIFETKSTPDPETTCYENPHAIV